MKKCVYLPAGKPERYCPGISAYWVTTLLFCFALQACTVLPPQSDTAVNKVPLRPTSLTPVAADALTNAQNWVSQARAKGALWISALNALNMAQTAAQEFDSEQTLQFSQLTVALCTQSVRQLDYPAVKLIP